MREIRYVVVGAVIGMAVAALGAAAVFFALPAAHVYSFAPTATPTVTPSATATASLTATRTPTATPIPPTLTPSPTPLPTSTPDAIQSLVNSGGLVFTGPLTNAEQIALYEASINYARDNTADSQRVGVQINGAGYGDPGNICGPLAIAILRDAGLIASNAVPHDYWLLNPKAATDARLLERTFPSGFYDHLQTLTPINKIDWRASPLVPGDFLFIWHGAGGNFDHMLVVSRVDSGGRAYAVTNYGTPDGFIIREAMLYDPNDPTEGLFHLWTQERDAILGSTGFGGFEVWRRR